jgi:hypothetical protein
MTEKSKRFNPFVGMMEEGEDILWLSAQTEIPFAKHVQRLVLGWLLVSACYVLPSILPSAYPSPINPLTTLVLCSGMLFPVCFMAYWIYARSEAKRRAHAYLLTDKHIYTSTPQAGAALYPLERIYELYPSTSQTITLDVGAPKPVTLKYIKNARAIATLMENARLDRLEELGLHEEDDDEREEQAQSLRRYAGRR